QAGSGFLSQHSKELFFGVGKSQETVQASIHWPSGLTQSFNNLPVNHRINIEESSAEFLAKPFAPAASYGRVDAPRELEALPSSVETWLIEPLRAPDFSLPDLAGKFWGLQSFLGGLLLLNFWVRDSSTCRDQLQLLRRNYAAITLTGLR